MWEHQSVRMHGSHDISMVILTTIPVDRVDLGRTSRFYTRNLPRQSKLTSKVGFYAYLGGGGFSRSGCCGIFQPWNLIYIVAKCQIGRRPIFQQNPSHWRSQTYFPRVSSPGGKQLPRFPRLIHGSRPRERYMNILKFLGLPPDKLLRSGCAIETTLE